MLRVCRQQPEKSNTQVQPKDPGRPAPQSFKGLGPDAQVCTPAVMDVEDRNVEGGDSHFKNIRSIQV